MLCRRPEVIDKGFVRGLDCKEGLKTDTLRSRSRAVNTSWATQLGRPPVIAEDARFLRIEEWLMAPVSRGCWLGKDTQVSKVY